MTSAAAGSQCGNGGSVTISRNSGRRRAWGTVSNAYFFPPLFGVLPSHFFFPFKFQFLFSLLKPQASQKFWNKSLSFPLITQNICHFLRNVHYIHIFFVQNDFHLFYFIYSRLTLHHHSSHRITLSLPEDGAVV